jgi:hypothetical protein
MTKQMSQSSAPLRRPICVRKMELIALNIGHDMGILSGRIFTMLVIMALVTTVMSGPLVTLFGKTRQVSLA